MPRIVCVSNRLPALDPVTGNIRNTGGLAVGVEASMKELGGGIWVGWNGKAGQAADQVVDRTSKVITRDNIELISFPLTPLERDVYLTNMANKALWPLCHELLDKVDEDGTSFGGYKKVNNLFAKQLLQHLKPDDEIWVHDYHLIPLGNALRQLGVTNKIRYFHHIPIPHASTLESPTLGTELPGYIRELVSNLFSYDSIGFQSFRDLQNFKSLIGDTSNVPQERFKYEKLVYQGAEARFGVFPISVETSAIPAIASSHINDPELEDFKVSLHGRPLIISAERADYTKGIREKMLGLDKYLSEYALRPVFLQIAPASRSEIDAYGATVDEMQKLAGRINGHHGTPSWQPVRLSHGFIERHQLLAYFRMARVGFITPLADGQNLTAKEYLAAQDPADPGVLVLGKGAGAAEELGDAKAALIVDPRNAEQMAAALHAALNMPLAERQAMHQRAMDVMKKNDIGHWARACLEMNAPPAAPSPQRSFNRHLIP